MAKENVAKFFEKLGQDAALAEKLSALDKAFAEKNDAQADDAAMREQAAEAVVLPLAGEVGLPFTLEELKEYELEQLKGMNLSGDELDQVAGGKVSVLGTRRTKSQGLNACSFIGLGAGLTKKKNGKTAFCILIGGSNGPVVGSND